MVPILFPEYSLCIRVPQHLHGPRLSMIFERALAHMLLPTLPWCNYEVSTTFECSSLHFNEGWLDAYRNICKYDYICNMYEKYDYISGFRAAHARHKGNLQCVNS